MNKHGSRWIRPEKRLAIYIRDDFACVYCGLALKDAPPADVTLDHLDARTNGGNNDASNLITACRRCNSQRQAKPWQEYATGGGVYRIETQRQLPLNLELAKALIAGDTE